MEFFKKLKSVLSPNAQKMKRAIKQGFTIKKTDPSRWQELLAVLTQADIAPHIARELISDLPAELDNEAIAIDKLCNSVVERLQPYEKKLDDLFIIKDKPKTILMVGVNGTGKTTSIAKLASLAKQKGLKPLLVAGDSFRAGGITQLTTWAKKIGVDYYENTQTTDPAAIAHMGYQEAVAKNHDIVFIDTAGRLHTNQNLMAELEKIIRVLKKIDSDLPHDCVMTLDATVGQNALLQVEQFQKSAPLSAIIITKMDGTAKGGMVLSVIDKYRLPLMALGVGEKPDDIDQFRADDFAKGFFGKE